MQNTPNDQTPRRTVCVSETGGKKIKNIITHRCLCCSELGYVLTVQTGHLTWAGSHGLGRSETTKNKYIFNSVGGKPAARGPLLAHEAPMSGPHLMLVIIIIIIIIINDNNNVI